MRFFVAFLVVLLSFAATANADLMEGRMALTAERHSQCAASDWGYPCGWSNVETFAPVLFEGWSDPVAPVYRAGTDEILPSMEKVMVPAYTFQGNWRESEAEAGKGFVDWEAIFINHSGDGPNYCETWGTQPNWNAGRTEAWHGGCMNYNPDKGLKAFPYPLGSQASGLPFVGTIITQRDWEGWIKSGAVPNHPVGMVVPYSCSTWRAPANRTDGESWWRTPENNDECIELGTRYKLAQSWNPNYTIWSPFTRLLIAMAKKKGVIAVDQNHCCVVVRVENWQRYYAPWTNWDWKPQDPYHFGWDDRLMRQFPLKELRLP
jgi:hypothetical protein